MRSNSSAYISASDEYIACTDEGNECHRLKHRLVHCMTRTLHVGEWHRLKLFSRRKKRVQTPQLPRLNHFILNIKFLQDGSLMATGTESVKYYLNKYQISSSKTADGKAVLSLVWSSRLVDACGIAVNSDDSHIFVRELDGRRIYLLNSEGLY